MAAIVWSSSFATGVEAIDAQHQELIELLNSVIEPSQVKRGTLSHTLDRISSYALTHFRTEEQIMQEHDYPDLPTHSALHGEYVLSLTSLFQKESEYDTALPDELKEFLYNWWTSHIMKEDMAFRDYLNGEE